MSTKEDREREAKEISVLLEKYEIEIPKFWDEISHNAKIEYIANKILAQNRNTKKHSEMKDYLTAQQLHNRLRKEVYSNLDSGLEVIPPTRGVFSRTYAGKNTRSTRIKDEDY